MENWQYRSIHNIRRGKFIRHMSGVTSITIVDKHWIVSWTGSGLPRCWETVSVQPRCYCQASPRR